MVAWSLHEHSSAIQEPDTCTCYDQLRSFVGRKKPDYWNDDRQERAQIHQLRLQKDDQFQTESNGIYLRQIFGTHKTFNLFREQ